jgi:hypothetical protein
MEVEVGAFRKVMSFGLIWLLTVQTSWSVQAKALGQMAPPPTGAGVSTPKNIGTLTITVN